MIIKNDWNIQYSSTALLSLVNPCILHRNNRTTFPTYVVSSEKKTLCYQLCSTRYAPVRISNCLKRIFVIKVATMDNFCNKWKPPRVYHKIDTFRGEQRWMDTKEGRGKSMKNAMHVQRYGKRYLLGWSDVKQQKNQVHSLSHCWVMRVWRHQAVS